MTKYRASYPRVSIFTCCSTAAEMLRFSSEFAILNAGCDKWDYIIVTWNPSKQVMDVVDALRERYSFVHHVEYQTQPDIGYVPNLRGMMNTGFRRGFELNEYCGLTNADVYHGPDWLWPLIQHCCPADIISSTHLTPGQGPNVITCNLGVPVPDQFNLSGFMNIYRQIVRDAVETEEELGGWDRCLTMPYLIPKYYWEQAGPWELEIGGHQDAPDRRFFQRCKDAGAHFTISRKSVIYHHHAVERTGQRPPGAEQMPNES